MVAERTIQQVHRWTEREREVLAAAVDAAPSLQDSRPWRLHVDEVVELRQRPVAWLEEQDPGGRDRLMSCGSALANLLLAVRHLGRAPEVRRDLTGGELVATIRADRAAAPVESEQRRFAAIEHRASHRGPFSPEPVPAPVAEAVRAAGELRCGEARWVAGEEAQVARALAYAFRVLHDDLNYQRELDRWTVGGPGIPQQAQPGRGLSAAGLVTGATRLPDESVLAERMRREHVLVLCSAGDDPADHVRIGEAAELSWLEATARGLAVSVMTQPLRLREVRRSLCEDLGLPGQPHILMRIGNP